MDQLKILDDILFNGLSPWLSASNPDEMYISMPSEIKVFESRISMRYEIDFFRPFNNKTKYYQKLIFREMNRLCESFIQMINENEDSRVRKFLLNDILDKKLNTRIKEIGKLIKERKLDINYIDPAKSTFDQDSNHKTDTYIIQLLKTCLLKIYLEIQDSFSSFRDEILIIEDFYTQLLFEPIPSNTFLKEVRPIIPIKPEKAITPEISENLAQGPVNSFTYKKLITHSDNLNNLFDNLKKNKLIAEDSTVINFKKVFSGKEILQPVVWVGNPSELYYFIHLIYKEYQLVDDLKQKQWKIACNCFVPKNEEKFDPAKLRLLKKPQLSAHLIEKAVGLLK